MSIDKSLSQHYEMQGGVKNFLGKQKMVKAPKKWKSGPDHPDTELAYITKAEKDLILKADLHNSLSKGPNKGPSGIISLNSAGSGYGGPGPGRNEDRGSGGGNGRSAHLAAQSAAAANQAAANRAAEQKAAAEREMRATIAQAESNQREAERSNQLAEARKLMTQPVTVDVPIKGPELIPGTTGPVTLDPYQQNYISPGRVDIKDRYQTGDYADLVKAPVDVGFQEALRKQQIATDLRQKQQDPDYGQFFRPQPVVETPKSGIWGGLKTMGKGALEMALMPFLPKPVRTAWQTKKRYDALQKSALGKKLNLKELNLSNLRSSIDKGISGRQFDPKDPIGWTGEQKRKKTFHEPKGDGDKQQGTTVEEAIAGKTSLGAGALGLPELQKRMATLHQLKQNEDFWNQLTDVQKRNINMAMMNYFKMIDQYSVKPNEGRIRNIG